MPALLNNKSRRPNFSSARPNSASTEDGSETSAGTARQRLAFEPASAKAPSSNSLRLPANTTEYPSRSSARATALPIPVPAPVIKATLAGVFIDGFLEDMLATSARQY